MAETYFSQLRVELRTLKENQSSVADWDSDQILGEVISVQANFSLNSIPTMTIQVPPGIRITERQPGPEPVSYVEQRENNLLQEAYTHRKPVGVYLQCRQEKKTDLLPDKDACLFKGYILTWSSGFGAANCTHTLVLMHWLVDLDIFPVINRLSAPENPTDLSYHAFFRLPEDLNQVGPRSDSSGPSNRVFWTPARTMSEDVRRAETLFPGDAVLSLLAHTLSDVDKLRENTPGYLNKDLFTRTTQALAKIKGSNYGKLDLETAGGSLQGAVADWISSQNYAAYAGITIWQKMITSLLPELLLCLIPTSTEVYLAPVPGLRRNHCKELKLEEMTSLQYRHANRSTLGGMLLCTRNCPEVENVLAADTPAAPTIFHCPPDLEPGVLKSCFMPGWLLGMLHQQSVFTNSRIPDAECVTSNATKEAFTSQDARVTDPEGLNRLCQSFVNTCYLNEVTKNNSASLTTPLRFDLLPGDTVKMPLPVNQMRPQEPDHVYGTIRTVTYTIQHGTVQSAYVINNIRTQAVMDKLGDVQGFLYKDYWRSGDDLDLKLYTLE